MKIIKWIVTLGIIAGVAWLIADNISPRLSINSLNPQHIYGDKITFRINVINFSPQPKEIYIGAGDNLDVSLLIDGANAAKKLPKEEAAATVSLPAFSNKTIERSVTLAQATTETQPQVLSITNDTLSVTPGKHSVKATWGGHTSEEYTFGVR